VRRRDTLVALCGLLALTAPAGAQQIRGRILDEANGAPVPAAGVYLLDRDRETVAAALADNEGRYQVDVPADGEYILRVQRLGYFETESPLVAVEGDRVYDVDFTVRPEPIRIEGLEVEVEPERQNRWARDRLAFMDPRRAFGNPAEALGFRLITGVRLEEAKLRADDTLDLLRWVFVPVYNTVGGLCVQMRPVFDRNSEIRAMSARRDRPAPTPTCGEVVIDGIPFGVEHVESMDFREIHAVLVVPPEIHILTVGFEQRFQQGHR